ncbi:1-phosphofructokinase family hexose kinase [Flaviaesturariibacter flavus]|uniref:1-phosphofructokinase family hexose kinase n=1 Tax=Flaviaesturariibacter flavus TaxID=2502780 RepID=A0A4R1B589_9BACT|nr:1-phosphofructokinase family hexose kinase [Flaviaesturariibacter flavus]TCJ13292.1 1-phosphofructokinase family hexose kinase [Flaviaesturariibacter flavus]
MILTVTFNPAIDKSTSIDRLVPDKKLRGDRLVSEPGGGGINVSKALQELGAPAKALFLSGGVNGAVLERLLNERGLPFEAVPAKGETRESFTVLERGTNAQYRFVLPGDPYDEADGAALFRALEAAPRPEFVVASGSLPPGAPDDLYAQLAAHCRRIGARLVVDTSGVPLQRAVDTGVFLIKPNLSELCALTGRTHLELHEVDDAAREVLGRGGCSALIVSMGPSGALAVTSEGEWRIPAPVVRKQSTVGAGDSMIAGICHALLQGRPLPDAARFGVACGTAATMNPGSQLFKKEDAERLYEWIRTHS